MLTAWTCINLVSCVLLPSGSCLAHLSTDKSPSRAYPSMDCRPCFVDSGAPGRGCAYRLPGEPDGNFFVNSLLKIGWVVLRCWLDQSFLRISNTDWFFLHVTTHLPRSRFTSLTSPWSPLGLISRINSTTTDSAALAAGELAWPLSTKCGRNPRSSLGGSNGRGRSSAELELYGRGWSSDGCGRSSDGVDRSRAWMSTQSRGHSRSMLELLSCRWSRRVCRCRVNSRY
jgi:hypothetical protein